MALALDGSVHGSTTATSLGVTLTTSNTDDVIIVIATVNQGPITSISGAGLTWNFIASGGTGIAAIEIWYAIASSALSSQTITVTQTASGFITVDAFGISGANTSSPFDANASTPATGTTATLTVSTDTADTFIIGGYRFGSTASPTEGTGWTKIFGANFQLSEFKIVSSTQSSLSVAIGTGAGDQNGGVADAVVIAAAGGASLLLMQQSFRQ